MTKNCCGGHICGWGSENILRTRFIAIGDLRLQTRLVFSRMCLRERNAGPYILEKVHSETRASLGKGFELFEDIRLLSWYRRYCRNSLLEIMKQLAFGLRGSGLRCID